MTTRRHSYNEATLTFDGDPLASATRVVQSLGDDDDYVLYESANEWSLGVGADARITVYPDRAVVSRGGVESEHVIANPTDLARSLHEALRRLPIDGWRVYGAAQFELSRFLYGLPVPDGVPLIRLFVPREEVRIRGRSICVRVLDGDALERLQAVMSDLRAERDEPARPPLVLEDEMATHNADPYKKSVQAALEEIWSQRYRKVILSRRIPLSHRLDMPASYLSGRRPNAPARSYLLRLDGLQAAGFSPETVAEVTASRDVFTTPLAGTRSTGEDIHQELALREELLADSKEIAEHAISVYVAFDELTMACDPTSVRVVNFMLVSRRGAVQHLASRVAGKLLESCNPWHAFNAVFPAVTASGVPKRESIDAIGRHESQPRGLYAGCVMICDQSGALDSALVLRSFYQDKDQTWMQAGAGIMNMSKPERELEETREKLSSFARYLIAAS